MGVRGIFQFQLIFHVVIASFWLHASAASDNDPSCHPRNPLPSFPSDPAIFTSPPLGEEDSDSPESGSFTLEKFYHYHPHIEPHDDGAMGNHIKSVVFGGIDGIIAIFAIVSSVVGAELDLSVDSPSIHCISESLCLA